MLSVRGLHKSYRDGDRELHVLKGLDLEMPAGQSLAVMGPSGCGKSTLISCLAGLSRADQGEIRVKDMEMTKLSPRDLTSFRAKNVGVVFQQFHLVPHLTALENIRLPLDFQGVAPLQAQERAQEALRLVNLTDRARHFPHQLSRGECQRVAIARVLVTTPQLILADEPTASLDRQTGREILALLIDLSKRQNAGLIVVTHDQEMAKSCDVLFHFEAGRLRRAN